MVSMVTKPQPQPWPFSLNKAQGVQNPSYKGMQFPIWNFSNATEHDATVNTAHYSPSQQLNCILWSRLSTHWNLVCLAKDAIKGIHSIPKFRNPPDTLTGSGCTSLMWPIAWWWACSSNAIIQSQLVRRVENVYLVKVFKLNGNIDLLTRNCTPHKICRASQEGSLTVVLLISR